MGQIKVEIPQGQDIQWVDKQYPFDGAWMPDVDPALIGARNFSDIQNLRYNDRSVEGVNGYTRINETYVIDGGATVGAGGTYLKLRNGHQLRSDRLVNSFVLVHAVDSGDQGRVYQNTGTIHTSSEFDDTSNLDINGNPYFEDVSSGLEGRFSNAPQNSIVYCNGEENAIYSGFEHRMASCFHIQDTPTVADAKFPKEVTEQLNSTLNITSSQITFDATYDNMLVMTTRPIQAFKVYVDTASTDGTADIEVKTWTGSGFGADLVSVDGTASGSQTLQQTGVVTLSAHTLGTSVLMHYEELYLYAYLISFVNATSNVDAVIYQITIDPAMQPIQNVWDGVYRQPIQFQVEDNSVGGYADYTLHVNQSSDVQAPVGADLSAIGAALDNVVIMFEEQMAGIRFTMLGTLLNILASVATVKYWDGDSYVAVTNLNDGTIEPAGTTFGQSGLMSWTPPADEETQTLFGSVGYAYEITFSSVLSGTTPGDETVIVDLCFGVPALTKAVNPFKFSALYQNRLMLGGFSSGAEGNRMDFSVSNAPDVFNGFESSADGIQSLFFGGVEDITAATQLYNRFGASIFSMLLVLKDTEVYLLVGTNPDDFIIYPVAETVGCPAPLTLAVAEIGFEVGQGLTRNVAIWLSHFGPMMFDGAILSPVHGIQNYFDPNENEYIEWDNISNARGWVDQTYKEYNLLIPSGTDQVTNNVWLVYDLIRKKWFKKDTGSAEFPQMGFNVMDVNTGEQRAYGGIDTGYLINMEDGTSWNATFGTNTDGTGIRQFIRTGDFFPSSNIWDEVLIRKFKLISKKLPASATATFVNVNYYSDSAESGANVIFQDSDASLGVNVSFTDMDVDLDGVNETEWASSAAGTLNLSLGVGLSRVVRLIQDLNNTGWAHAFEFEVTTTDANKGWQPIIWGIQFRVERKDNKATVG